MKRALALVIILVALVSGTVAFTQSFSVQMGGTKGPKQPIFFSHKVHAGVNQIDCQYCHTGAAVSPIANIPAMSTCMGCHKMVSGGDNKMYVDEITKLQGYFERGEQIQWVEVYRLPDYVKFNHKRHVKAGIVCQNCHGPVQEMDTVYQYPSLKMGWCVSCHRQKLEDPKFPATLDCVVCHH
jgi:hypothetical protein